MYDIICRNIMEPNSIARLNGNVTFKRAQAKQPKSISPKLYT